MKNTAKTKNPTLNVIKGDLDAIEKLLISVYNSLGEWLHNCEKLKKCSRCWSIRWDRSLPQSAKSA